MKIDFILSFVLTVLVLTSLQADDQPLIPAALNALLPKISAGMTSSQIQKVLSSAYPQIKSQLGDWSGQSGYIDFKLDDRYRISILGRNDSQGREVVHEDILIYIFDQPQRNRIEIRRYH